jgi:hypothetical protein
MIPPHAVLQVLWLFVPAWSSTGCRAWPCRWTAAARS